MESPAVLAGACLGPDALTSALAGADQKAVQAALCAAALAREPEAWSLLGRPLYAPRLTGLVNLSVHEQLQIARDNLEFDACGQQGDPSKRVWLARRLGYAWRFREALGVLEPMAEAGAVRSPLHRAEVLRHTGHRLITVRNLSAAATTLRRAAALVRNASAVPARPLWEEDGAPNAANLPLSTLQFNSLYHLTLAEFLRGDWEAAEAASRECVAAAVD